MSPASRMQWPSSNDQKALIGPATFVAVPKFQSTIFPRKVYQDFACHESDGGGECDDDVATECTSSSHSRDGAAYPPCSNFFLPHHTTRHIRIEELTRPIFTVWPRSTSKYLSLHRTGRSGQPQGYLHCESRFY
jgi:hypothetical protein